MLAPTLEWYPRGAGALSWCRSKRHRGRRAALIDEPPEGGHRSQQGPIAACHSAGSSSGFFSGSVACLIFTPIVYLVRRSHGGPSMCSAACVRSLVDGSLGRNCWNCQTFAAFPAEPGGSLGIMPLISLARHPRGVNSIDVASGDASFPGNNRTKLRAVGCHGQGVRRRVRSQRFGVRECAIIRLPARFAIGSLIQ